MILFQTNLQFRFSITHDVIHDIHQGNTITKSRYKIIRLGCFTIIVLPKYTERLYWAAIHNITRDADWYIKNNGVVQMAANKASSETEAKLNKKYRTESDNLSQEIVQYREKNDILKRQIKTLKQSIKILSIKDD